MSHPLSIKIKIFFLMGVGTLPGIISILRTTSIPDVSKVSNATRDYADLMMYCALEFVLDIVLNSIQVSRPLFEGILDKSKPTRLMETLEGSRTWNHHGKVQSLRMPSVLGPQWLRKKSRNNRKYPYSLW
ncbi:hypothetical protein K461DRAFT_94858 [Myriangium duriaei CBS 260.36]|uniref:Rhodopsin domain-containing protein n=1 Tax=Myriangium duriaei CBS 260.36 TaxID=1168546 RepID=A0A9P4J957_9PEZI|nr:hypothetical protein K461DRAFT_94858 [Myriangium duriaei CBS 260.36]